MAFVHKSRWYAGAAAVAAIGLAAPAAAQDTYMGELLKVPYTFCPRDTYEANGQLISIANNSALYALFGTTYGGDGVNTFAMPDMRGRYSMHVGTGNGLTTRVQGQTGGTETNTMTLAGMPKHEHIALMKATSDAANTTTPVGNNFATTPAMKYINGTAPNSNLMERGSIVVANAGGNQPYSIVPPLLAIRYCVKAFGIFPSSN
ncbi:MAG: phage tail protein [Sphingopyxis sp.]